MIFIGITGTNGKTTITYLLEHIFERLGCRSGVIGTVITGTPPFRKTRGRRTFLPPREPLVLQALLRTMPGLGFDMSLMEASSHALFQHRLGDIQVRCGGLHQPLPRTISTTTRDYGGVLCRQDSSVHRLPEKGRQRRLSPSVKPDRKQSWPSRLADLCNRKGYCIHQGRYRSRC